jgi:hypothetical protein
MDNELLIASLSFTFIGGLGIYLSFLPISETLFEMIFPASFILVFGLILFPAALLKGGVPILSSLGKAVAGLAIMIFVASVISVFLFLL